MLFFSPFRPDIAAMCAAIVLARQHSLALTLVDCGIAAELPPHPQLRTLNGTIWVAANPMERL